MITLLHGDNVSDSRSELLKIRNMSDGADIVTLNGKNIDTAILVQALESTSLFGEKKAVILENVFLNLGKKKKAADEFVAILKRAPQDVGIYIWEEKEVPKSLIKELGPNVRERIFKIPQAIFQFLDGIRPDNARNNLRLLEEAALASPVEVIFVLLVRRMRQLIMLKDRVDPAGIQAWQKNRLTSQVKLFTMEQLQEIYRDLAQLEYSFKRGMTPYTIKELLEELLLHL